MAYTPINWQTGDTITAEKMNKMDNGWGMQNTQLFSETATTVAGEYGNETELTYAESITADSITVTFDGNEYTCPSVIVNGNICGYGGVDSSWAYDFSQYPFAIVSDNGVNYFATQTAGTYAVALTAPTVAVGDNFITAVKKIFVLPIFTQNGQNFTCNMTFTEVKEAIISGGCCYALQGSSVFLLTLCGNERLVFVQTQVFPTRVASVALIYSSNGSISTETVTYPSN